MNKRVKNISAFAMIYIASLIVFAIVVAVIKLAIPGV